MKTKLLAVSLLLASVSAMGEDALKQIQTWVRTPEQCSRAQLLQYLRSDDIRVRSAALDFLENVSGQDFGLDAWLPPSEVPQHVQEALQQWCELEEKTAFAHAAPTAQQTQECVELLRTADPDTARRICLRFAAHPAVLSAAIVQRLQEASTIPQAEQDRLRHAQYRIHLLSAMGDNAVPVATALTSHVRGDTLDALESLREVRVPALPVVMEFSAHSDALVREVAIDILLDVGRNTAFDVLCDSLMAEADSNILQIAAKRLAVCKAKPNVVRFLRQCALSDDEDIALAGLETLAALAENSSDSEEEKPSADLSADMLNVAQCAELLKSPHWRIRAAMLDLLAETAPFVQAVAKNQAIQQSVVALLQDDDETVRQYAATAIIKARMALEHLEALTEYAMSTPSMTPFVMALYCSGDKKLPPALLELLPRMTVADVLQLIQYDEANHGIFSDTDRNHRNYSPMMMGLLANPDAQVRTLLIRWVGREMMRQSTDFTDAVFEWLDSPAVDFEEKYDFLNSSYSKFPSREKERLVAWFKTQFATPEAQSPERRTKLLMLLYEFDADAASAYVGSYVLQTSKGTRVAFTSNSMGLIPLLETDDAVAIINDLSVSFVRSFISHADINIITSEQKEKWLSLLTSPQIREDSRCIFFIDALQRAYHEESLFFELSKAYIEAALAENAASLFSRMVIVATCCQQSPQWDELKEKARAVIPQLPADLQAFIECVDNLPTTAQAVEPWATQYAASEHVCVRRIVACCLLPLYRATPFLIFEGEQPVVLTFEHPMSRVDLKRKSCPVSLIRLVDHMQQDADDLVSFFAGASMLYRTGDCDRARFIAHLTEYKKKNDEETSFDFVLSHIDDVLNEVWKRWHEHRTGVEEPFKLKGSPKKLKPGIETVLVQLRNATGNVWGLIPEVKKYVSEDADSEDSSVAAVKASDFRFAAPAAESPPAAQPDTAQDAVSADDADTEEVAMQVVDRHTPVKVEFFHTKGCNDCKQAMALLDALRATYPKLHVTSHDVESDAGKQRNLVLCERYGVPAEQKRKAPILFAESGYIYGTQITKDNVLTVLDAAIAGKRHELLPEAEQTPQQPAPATPVATVPATDLLADTQADEAEQADAQLKQQNIIGYVVLGLGAVLFLVAAAVFLFVGRRKQGTES